MGNERVCPKVSDTRVCEYSKVRTAVSINACLSADSKDTSIASKTNKGGGGVGDGKDLDDPYLDSTPSSR